MMKKALILASVMAFTMSTAAFAESTTTPAVPLKSATPSAQKPKCSSCQKPPKKNDFKKRNDAFEKRLKLTDKQKEQAKQIRMKGHEEMKPVMEQIKAKHMEADAVRRSRIAPQMQEEKLLKINSELRDLRRQAHELRVKNMKEFEAILTPKQKKELQKIKAEGRKRFEQEHKRKGGHGTNFGARPEPRHDREHGPVPPPPPID